MGKGQGIAQGVGLAGKVEWEAHRKSSYPQPLSSGRSSLGSVQDSGLWSKKSEDATERKELSGSNGPSESRAAGGTDQESLAPYCAVARQVDRHKRLAPLFREPNTCSRIGREILEVHWVATAVTRLRVFGTARSPRHVWRRRHQANHPRSPV